MIKVMIHTYPARLWYVEDFLVPSLREQGIEDIRIWNDDKKRGNLFGCMDAFASCAGGDTWHLQDDVLICRDFAERVKEMEDRHGVICGFVNEVAGPDANIYGTVYMPDMWFSFPCIRIPDKIANECAAWTFSKEPKAPHLEALFVCNSGDDTFFQEFMQEKHGTETATNLRPCLVEHIDFLLGGSSVNPWRGFYARAAYWDDDELVEDLKTRIKARERAF